MEIQYLKTVLLVATHLNFSKVAEEIPCAPSSVSRQVKCVEEALGITLFDRPARGEGKPRRGKDQGRRGLPPEPPRRCKDSTEQPSLMKPFYINVGR